MLKKETIGSDEIIYNKFGGSIVNLPNITVIENDKIIDYSSIRIANNYNKKLQITTVFDTVFIGLYALIFWELIFLIFIPIIAFFCIRKYKLYFINFYLLFNIFNLAARFYLIIDYNNIYNNENYNNLIVSIISSFFISISLFTHVKFFKSIHNLSSLSLHELANGYNTRRKLKKNLL